MSAPHLFGKYRLSIVHVLAVTLFFLVWFSSGNFFRGVILGGISWGVFWVLTTEVMLRFSLSAIPAFIAFRIMDFITEQAFGDWGQWKGPGAGWVFNCFGPVLALIVAWVWAYYRLSKSSWIGTPCPHCHSRGKTEMQESAREYFGQKLEKSDGKYVTYNIYDVTYRHWCNSCGVEWQSTGRVSERA